jgi:mRNA interferase MazF
MKRSEVWTASAAQDYAGKPRLVVILQDDRFDETASVTICILTTRLIEVPMFRLAVAPTDGNGLKRESQLMVDKITTIPKSKLGQRIGKLADEDMLRLNRAVLVFLGLAGPQQGV